MIMRLDSLFQEDLDMRDELEMIKESDDSMDVILSMFNDRGMLTENKSLFENYEDEEVIEDGMTSRELAEFYTAKLEKCVFNEDDDEEYDDDDLLDDILDDDDDLYEEKCNG